MAGYLPEGLYKNSIENRAAMADEAALRAAMDAETVLEAQAVLCDSDHALHVMLPCMEGVIPREEGAVGIEDGTVRDIALLSRVGKSVCFTVTGIETRSDGTRRALLSRRRAQEQCKAFLSAHLRVGDVVCAKVTRLEGFGAFCDIGCGVAALLPIASMSVSRIAHPSDRVAVGEVLRCVVSSMEEGRICLSMRELLGTWEQNAALFEQGQTVLGVVRSVETYGVFVELTPNLAGLAESFEGACVGQTATVFIKSVIPEKMKIKLVILDVQEGTPPKMLRYFETGEHIDRWSYAPEGCARRIETVFGLDK